MSQETIPVTVLSGNLGAGKTTVLNNLLNTRTDLDVAVLVNDMGEVNVDAERVAEHSDISEDDEELIELSNGCICCELRGDLLDALAKLAQAREFDYLVIESTGVAEPLPVAQTLTMGFDQGDLDPTEFYEETGIEVMDYYELDTTVTVVDAHQFWTTFDSKESLMDGDTEKDLGSLLVEQIEFCDVLLLNKCDLVDEETLDEIEEMVEVLQPRAEIIRTEHGAVDPEAIVDTGRFDFEAASQSAGWMQELQEPHESAEEEHGVTSFVFESRRPFHPERFADLLDDFPTNVVRSKGHFWLAGRPEMGLGVDVAGQSIRIEPVGRWVAALPEEEQAQYFEAYPELEENWHPTYGDRGSRLVIIGADMDHDELRAELETATLTDKEMDADWDVFEDRFPTFEGGEDAEDPTDEGTQPIDDSAEEVGLAD
ncbi:cobalamin synthesis protein P47K [Haloferax elongans ATCC BAA-1513]|uniref:Cobalamin synthesis protein P47K n=1 Tax=Haloferax elongans ATCC BAA-1513 TaxID=1230453 RepID=M0I0V0_HALEO|nr:GTP-binding protein [Haloferax elongans]ELZ88999.1 cobalamin synthesis protein P47K [Haloferax elongans ATCC BAA-1513]